MQRHPLKELHHLAERCVASTEDGLLLADSDLIAIGGHSALDHSRPTGSAPYRRILNSPRPRRRPQRGALGGSADDSHSSPAEAARNLLKQTHPSVCQATAHSMTHAARLKRMTYRSSSSAAIVALNPSQHVGVQGEPAPLLPGLCVALDLDRPRLGKRRGKLPCAGALRACRPRHTAYHGDRPRGGSCVRATSQLLPCCPGCCPHRAIRQRPSKPYKPHRHSQSCLEGQARPERFELPTFGSVAVRPVGDFWLC
jgi:hypothetical protein